MCYYLLGRSVSFPIQRHACPVLASPLGVAFTSRMCIADTRLDYVFRSIYTVWVQFIPTSAEPIFSKCHRSVSRLQGYTVSLSGQSTMAITGFRRTQGFVVAHCDYESNAPPLQLPSDLSTECSGEDLGEVTFSPPGPSKPGQGYAAAGYCRVAVISVC